MGAWSSDEKYGKSIGTLHAVESNLPLPPYEDKRTACWHIRSK
jgi:hypothetical protein